MALSCLVLPWTAYPLAGLGSFSDALAPAIVWKTLWPVLAGVGLFIGLRRLLHRLPCMPSGDIVVFGGAASHAATTLGLMITKVDSILRVWAVACLAVLVVVIVLAAAMLAAC